MLNPLPSKEKKRVLKTVGKQWGCEPEKIPVFQSGLLGNHLFFMSDKKRIIIASPELAKEDIFALPVNTLGLYFCRYLDGIVRLSIEGSQIIGPYAKTHVLDLSDEDAECWLRGENLSIDGETGFFILKNREDFIGCGRRIEGTIHNFVPKSRRSN